MDREEWAFCIHEHLPLVTVFVKDAKQPFPNIKEKNPSLYKKNTMCIELSETSLTSTKLHGITEDCKLNTPSSENYKSQDVHGNDLYICCSDFRF
jgi:hypothetical protein